ncbi:hypothetical protein [Longimicrobium sp.]|uniref:hypothetical protein n=1 Tax=Longimicrobium sp. TaxID=2029185 RepID=UPI002E33CDCF|nr:hypothetical protein [Longimicrobium sp.]HEX6041413.1 hypothetical protein [Longimicrobium sp.]
MAEFTPSIIPLGSLANAAAAGADVARQEQQLYAVDSIDLGTLTGDTSEPVGP